MEKRKVFSVLLYTMNVHKNKNSTSSLLVLGTGEVRAHNTNPRDDHKNKNSEIEG